MPSTAEVIAATLKANGIRRLFGLPGGEIAELMSACCAGAALVQGARPEAVERLAGFGRAFGMAFQLVDDALDGDALLPEGADTVERAEEYAAEALALLDGLEGREGAASLAALCGYVVDRAKVGVDRL